MNHVITISRQFGSGGIKNQALYYLKSKSDSLFTYYRLKKLCFSSLRNL